VIQFYSNKATRFPAVDYHLSNDDCLEDKREYYHNCSVLCCVRQLYTVTCIHTYEQFVKMCAGLGLSLVFVPLFMFSILCFSGLA